MLLGRSSGNVLYLEKNDRLALIDYGQVKRLSDKQRLDLAKTIVLIGAAMRHDPRADPSADAAAFARAKAGLRTHFVAIGCKTEKMLADSFYEVAHRSIHSSAPPSLPPSLPPSRPLRPRLSHARARARTCPLSAS